MAFPDAGKGRKPEIRELPDPFSEPSPSSLSLTEFKITSPDEELICECDKTEFNEKICSLCYTPKPAVEPELKSEIEPVLLEDPEKCGSCGKADTKKLCRICERRFCESLECFPLTRLQPMAPKSEQCKICTWKSTAQDRVPTSESERELKMNKSTYLWRFNRIRRRKIYPILLDLDVPMPIIDMIVSYYSDIHLMEINGNWLSTSTGQTFLWPIRGSGWTSLTTETVKRGIENFFEIMPNEVKLYSKGRELDDKEIAIRGVRIQMGGRPFTVSDGEYSTSDLSSKMSLVADWSVLPSFIHSMDISHFNLSQRQWLVKEWSADGLAEHASIGSFSRHILELLAVGAPSAIIADAQRAIGDEIIHARLCFALASKFSNTPIEPDQFPIKTSTINIRTNLLTMVEGLVSEGCMEETISAICAFVTLNLYPNTNDAMFLILQKIAMDEIRHAALSWKTLKWACDQGGKETQNKVKTLFEKHLSDLSEEKDSKSQVTPYTNDEMLSMGRLPASLRQPINGLTSSLLIQPWSEAVLNGQSPQRNDLAKSTEEYDLNIKELVCLGSNAIIGSW